MAQTVLARKTSANEVDEIGLRGQPVRTYWSQVRQHLREAPEVIQDVILAEPVLDRDSGDVEWYVQTDSEVVRYAELDDAGKRRVAGRMSSALQWVQEESSRLAASEDANDRLLGEVLTAAFEVPSLDELYATNERPVITSWGSLAPGPRPERGVLVRTFLSKAPTIGRFDGSFPVPSVQPRASAHTVPRGPISRDKGFLAMLVGGLSLAAAALFALYSSCGLRVPLLDIVIFDRCSTSLSSEPLDSLQALLEEERALRDQITGVNTELAELETECRVDVIAPTQPSPVPTPTPAPESVACGGQATKSGGQGRERYTFMLGSEPGTVQIRYCMQNKPDQLNARYQGEIVATTGEAVKGTNSLSFDYQPINDDHELIIEMIAKQSGTSWEFVVSCPGQIAQQCK